MKYHKRRARLKARQEKYDSAHGSKSALTGYKRPGSYNK